MADKEVVPKWIESVESDGTSVPLNSVDGSLAVASLERFLQRIKILGLFVGDTHTQDKVVKLLLVDESRERALQIFDDKDMSLSEKTQLIGEMSELERGWSHAEKSADKTPLGEVFKIFGEYTPPTISYKGTEFSIDSALEKLQDVGTDEITRKELALRVGEVVNNWWQERGPENLRKIDISDPQRYDLIRQKVVELKILAEKKLNENSILGELKTSKELFNDAYGEIRDDAKDRLLKVRTADVRRETQSLLTSVLETARGYLDDPVKLENASIEEITGNFEQANELLARGGALARGLAPGERARIWRVLTNIQVTYQQKLAEMLVKKLSKKYPVDDWEMVGQTALYRVLEKRRKTLSPKVVLFGKDAHGKVVSLERSFELEARDILRRRSRFFGSDRSSGDNKAERLQQEMNKEREKVDWNVLMRDVDAMSDTTKYNLFDDPLFARDIVRGDAGLDAIFERANKKGAIKDADAFRDMLKKMGTMIETGRAFRRKSEESGEMEEYMGIDKKLFGEISVYMLNKDYAAAGSLLLDYFSRVGLSENTSDMQMLYLLRGFLSKAGEKAPDYVAAFQALRGMNYVPGINGLGIEDFGKIAGKLFEKGTYDYVLNRNGLMSGVKVSYNFNGEDRVIALTPAKMLSLLRDTEAQIEILKAKPNTTDTVLWKTFLKDMYGEGVEITLGTEGTQDEGRPVLIKLPGAKDFVKLTDINFRVNYAEVDQGGFAQWRGGEGYEMNLKDFLQRETWAMRVGLQYMWYSGIWGDTLKTYQATIMAAAPKGLASQLGSMGIDYKYHYEAFSPFFIEVAHLFDNLLGPYERYRSADMLGTNVKNQLIEALDYDSIESIDERKRQTTRIESISKLLQRLVVMKNTAHVNGEPITYEGRLLPGEWFKYVDNDFVEFDSRLAEMARRRMSIKGFYAKDLPDNEFVLTKYREMLRRRADGTLMKKTINERGESAKSREEKERWNTEIDTLLAWGTEYESMWKIMKKLKLTDDERALIAGMSKAEFDAFSIMNEKVTGFREEITAENFFSKMTIESLISRDVTKHGDDIKEYVGKYLPNYIEASKVLAKIFSGQGTVADYEKFDDLITTFLPPEQRRKIVTAVLRKQIEMSKHGTKVLPRLKPDSEGNFAIDFVQVKDSKGNVIFVEDEDGSRAYHEQKFTGRYDKKIMNMDFWRPGHAEAIVERLRQKGIVNKEAAEELMERIAGTRGYWEGVAERAKENIIKRGGTVDEKAWEKRVEFISKWTSKAVLMAQKIFIFEDPWYAFWSFLGEAWGMTDKTFEHIFGMSITGGGGGKHH